MNIEDEVKKLAELRFPDTWLDGDVELTQSQILFKKDLIDFVKTSWVDGYLSGHFDEDEEYIRKTFLQE